MRTVAIIPAAGSGLRLKVKDKKPFVLLNGRPLIAHTLNRINSSRHIDSIVIAAEPGSIERLKKIVSRYGYGKVVRIVAGGKTRFMSVRNCFNAITPGCDIVLIHDCARPFVEERLIRDSIALARRFGACVTALPMTDTVKSSDRHMFVAKTLDRKNLWRAQTPQTFKYNLLKNALTRLKDMPDMTDDAAILERAGKRVRILEGSAANIKITTKEDLKLAEVLVCV